MEHLKAHKVDINSPSIVQHLINSAKELAHTVSNRRQLKVLPPCYFSVSCGEVPDEPGWYIILFLDQPIYVGTAQSLNKRLNTKNGSRDNFANTRRKSDSARNFIKKFNAVGILGDLDVIIITEADLASRVKEKEYNLLLPLEKHDRQNIEKLLNIFRSTLVPAKQL